MHVYVAINFPNFKSIVLIFIFFVQDCEIYFRLRFYVIFKRHV